MMDMIGDPREGMEGLEEFALQGWGGWTWIFNVTLHLIVSSRPMPAPIAQKCGRQNSLKNNAVHSWMMMSSQVQNRSAIQIARGCADAPRCPCRLPMADTSLHVVPATATRRHFLGTRGVALQQTKLPFSANRGQACLHSGFLILFVLFGQFSFLPAAPLEALLVQVFKITVGVTWTLIQIYLGNKHFPYIPRSMTRGYTFGKLFQHGTFHHTPVNKWKLF